MASRDDVTAGTAEQSPSRHLVVIGSSAGGIEALSILVATLDAGFPAPIVVAQHLDPHRPSHLSEILARRATLPVVTVDGRAALVPGTIHVVPANRNVEVTDHELQLTPPRAEGGPVPSVDGVLASAANVFGEFLTAVILTGSGSDGAEGARRVKAHGGTVVIQDPATARYPSMPGSLAPTSVDIIASVEAIGPLLLEIVTGAGSAVLADEERTLTTFLNNIRERSGIDFSTYKRATIVRRLQRRMAATRSEQLRDYLRYVAIHPEEYARLTSSFLIKVTEFFRDPELFEHLRSTLIPKLIEDARETRELRLWSAGCATGEEAYSLAILVKDALGDEIDNWSVRIFATDLDADAVAYARRGTYPASALDDLAPELVDRHFNRFDGEYEIKAHIRALVAFGQHDLALRAPFPRIDLVLCRNVLIYFTGELQRRALQLFAFSLRDGGWLVVGKAETTGPAGEYFVLEDPGLKLYRRRGQRPVIPFRIPEPGAIAVLPPRPRRGAVTPPPPAPGQPRQRSTTRPQASIDALPLGVILVSRSYDVESINPAARRLLGIHGTAVGQDLIHLADGVPGPEFRAAIDEALAGNATSVAAPLGSHTGGERGGWVEITCSPVADDNPEGQPRGVIVLVRDVSSERLELMAAIKAAEDALDEARKADALIESLRESNRRLAQANDEFTSTNAELRATNDELLTSNEEAQASTEEVETLNEELQATNEELETLNEELQATVEELNTTNDDLQARTVELQQMTADLDEQRRSAERERGRLEMLIKNLDDAVLVAGRGGRTIVSNDAFVQLFEVDKVEPLDEYGRPIPLEELRARTARGESVDLAFSVMRDGQRRWFEAYVRPQPAEMGLGEGGILVVHDTSDVSLRLLQEEFVGIVAHELRTPLTALNGYVQMLQRSMPDVPDPRILGLVTEQAERLHRLTDELFDVTLANRGRFTIQPRRLALGPLVRDTVEIARGLTHGQELRIEDSAGDLIIEGDAPRIQQVLLNLLSNAIIHAADSPEVIVRLSRLRRRAEIEVEDRGPGIPRDRQIEVFERFERGATARRGLGLGLYISRQIVLAHGGTLEVDSEPGEGATFTIRLPLARKQDGERRQDGRQKLDTPVITAATAGDTRNAGDGQANDGGRSASVDGRRRKGGRKVNSPTSE